MGYFGLVLLVVAIGLVKVFLPAAARLWISRRQHTDQDQLLTALSLSAGAEQHPVVQRRSDQLFDRYYLAPDPTGVPDALADYLDAPYDPANPCWYLFVRIARDNPGLVRRYEVLFRANAAGRPVLLKILQQVGDDETRLFLEACLQDPKLEPLREELEVALHDWPQAPIDPLARPVSTGADLDMLWCEFRATGSTEPVLRIIDVLERPDHIRAKLENWLHATPRQGFSIVATTLRKLTIRRLWRQASILCDADRREVLSPQDLDCHCTMQNMYFNKEHTLKVAKQLPFGLYGEDAYLLLKAAARWSLSSHAQQHPIILSLCESEAAKRTGRCRILLLEIVAYAALAGQDLEKAFNALEQSLTPDPEKDSSQRAKATAEWEQLLRLSQDSASPSAEQPPAARDAALRCIHATQAADTYRAKRLVRSVESGETSITWECEFAQPGNFRVVQTAGSDGDEWVTVGREHFRGPAYVPMASDPSKKLNPALLAGDHFTLLRRRKPVAFDVRSCEGSRYLFFEYRNVPAPTLSRLVGLLQSVGIPCFRCDALVWADLESARLAKVVITPKQPSKAGGKPWQIVHLFSCYDEPVSIAPPAFSLFRPTK